MSKIKDRLEKNNIKLVLANSTGIGRKSLGQEGPGKVTRVKVDKLK